MGYNFNVGFKVGDKVVPHSKSAARPFDECTKWNAAQRIGQNFLYIIDIEIDGNQKVYVCSHKNESGGNYYLAQDLKLYAEEANNGKKGEEPMSTVAEKTVTHQFKVGEKVRVKRGLDKYIDYKMKHNPSVFDNANARMIEMGGKILTIESCNRKYQVAENHFNWTDEMFEPVTNGGKPEMVEISDTFGINIHVEKVIYADPATIIFYKTTDNPKEILKRSVAKCNPADEYNKENGYKIAVLKAARKVISRKLSQF